MSVAVNRFNRDTGKAPIVLEIRKASFQVACNTDMKECNVATDGHTFRDIQVLNSLINLSLIRVAHIEPTSNL